MQSKLYVFLAIILCALVLSACSSDDDPELPESRTYQDLENDFDAIDISPGLKDISLQATDNLFWDIRVIAPQLVGNDRRPLVIALHGASGGSSDAHKNTACYIEPGLASLDAFIISPFGGIIPWYEQANQQQILTLINLAKKFWPVDETKIVVCGYSNGGNGSWFYTETRSEIFSAGIPMASSYSTYATDSTGRKIDKPLYVIHGETDELFPLEETQAWVQQSIDAGSNIEFVIAPGLGHYTPCDYVPFLQDAASWLEEVVWTE
jgi:predicted peptidase